uniref:Uncharacterized protein n=1 Tax=Ananas comosus var. bracteatus TaxID=296719 RepID=A0A6V7QP98_ANACO|nr:unnamed protein product [Ananas comosus var. bracteatus]
MAQENGGLSVISTDRVHNGFKDSLEAVSGKSSSAANSLDVGLRKGSVERVGKTVQTGHLRENYETRKQERDLSVSESGAENNGVCLEGDGAKEFQASSRMKSSGWDQLPGHSTKHGLKDVELDHINENEATTLDALGIGDSFRQTGSSSRRDMSSRKERPRSSDMPQSNEKSHVRASRSDDRNSLSLKAEAEMGAARSIGRGRLPWHTQGRGGDELPPNRSRPTHRRSPGFYGPPPSFATLGSRNAAAAAVAKVESNGFVVAPDGTIVKAAGSGTAGWAPKRSSHSSVYRRGSPTERDGEGGMPRGLRSVREMSPDRQFGVGRDRPDRYGPEIIRGRCRRAIRDEGMEASLSVHRRSLSRQKIFSRIKVLFISPGLEPDQDQDHEHAPLVCGHYEIKKLLHLILSQM